MAVKRGLGKGLSALLPTENEEPVSTNAVGTNAEGTNAVEDLPEGGETWTAKGGEIMVSPERLIPNPNQPRKDFDTEKLAELAETIRLQGIIQPVIVEEAGDGKYIIVDGERRVRAARIVGLEEVPVVLRQYSSDERRVEVSLTANIQRSDLNPIEEAAAYRQLMEMEGLGQDDVAAKVGKNRATVANALRLLKLPKEMQESIQKNELSPGHARAVLSVPGAKEQEMLFREILRKGLSVRDAEKRAASFGKPKKSKKEAAKSQSRPPELLSMEEKFITRLGTKVVINGDINKGTIMIDYYSMEDLERVFDIIDKP